MRRIAVIVARERNQDRRDIMLLLRASRIVEGPGSGIAAPLTAGNIKPIQ
jgi:hypothetical protein